MGIEVDRTSILKAWRSGDRMQVWVGLRGAASTIGRLGDALDEPEDSIEPGIVQATAMPDGFVALLFGIDHQDELDRRVDDLVGRLEAVGISGTLDGRPMVRFPDEVTRPQAPPADRYAEQIEPTGYFAVRFDHALLASPPLGGWCPNAATTDAVIAHHARWIAPGGPETVLTRETYDLAVDDPAAVVSLLTSAVVDTGLARALAFDRAARRGRWTTLTSPAWTTLQAVHGEPGWRWRIDALRAAMVELAPHLDQAFIGPDSRAGAFWISIGSSVAFAHGLGPGDVFTHPHLLATRLVDASGIQLVNDAHLERIADLDSWKVTALGHGRHLLEAPDLHPWYADLLPDQPTLDAARTSLGPALLTAKDIADDPGPAA